MADSRKITVSKTKIGEYVEERVLAGREPGKPWDQVEVVEVWYRDGRQGRGYYLDVSIWREQVEEYDSVERPGEKIKITSVMIGVGSSSVRELLEVVPRFSKARMGYWAHVSLSDSRLKGMRERVREMQGLPQEVSA